MDFFDLKLFEKLIIFLVMRFKKSKGERIIELFENR